MAEIALIPPYSRIADIRNRPLQMLLPIGLKSAYFIAYLDAIKSSKRVLLDNGLFEEGDSITSRELFELAITCRANEVVVPDVAFDANKTIDAGIKFLEHYWTHWRAGTPAITPAFDNMEFMFVVQGKTFEDRKKVIDEFVENVPHQRSVLGFPKRLTMLDTRARLETMKYAAENTKFPLHMLGLSQEWPSELLHAAREFGPRLRGLDTSAPYTYAYNNDRITTGWSPSGKRPEHYFDLPASYFSDELVKYNIYTLECWAGGLVPLSAWDWSCQDGM